MSAPLRHVDVGPLLGSWPMMPVPGSSGEAAVLPKTVKTQARILGTNQETSSGYALSGKSFDIWVAVPGTPPITPTLFNVSFAGADPYSLDDVIADINAAVSPNPPIAFRNNGFLMLESPVSGEESYLRLETDVPSDALFQLGLFPKVVSQGGDLFDAETIDPDRQVGLPNQLSWLEGENLESRVFNRMAFQLGVNTDRNEGLLSKKRIASKTSVQAPYSPTTPDGIQLSGYVYVGSATTPSLSELEKLFAILDEDGREFTEEQSSTYGGVGLTDFSVDSDNGNTIATSNGAYTFSSDDAEEDRYIVVSDFTGGASVLNDRPLKIIKYLSSITAVVSPVDPSTGDVVDLTGQSGKSTTHIEIETLKCRVSGVYDVGGGVRVEGVKDPKNTGVVPSRVDLSNRVVCPGEDFTPVVPGDIVTWSGHGVSSPYSNDGEYRVARVIDEETLELVSDDWGPVYLNPDLSSGAAGTIDITTDGVFWNSPFIQFDTAGGLPASGQQTRVIYGQLSTIRDATDDPALFFGSGTLYDQEIDSSVQQALLAIMGPSATNIDGWSRQDRNVNLESLDLRLNQEHHDHDGRHEDIRPDTIDMFPDVYGTTFHMRSDGVGESDTEKFTLTNFIDTQTYFSIYGDGVVWNDPGYVSDTGFGVNLQNTGTAGVPFDLPLTAFAAANAERLVFEITEPTSFVGNVYGALGGGPPAGTYQYIVTAIDANGQESMPSSDVYATVDGTEYVALEWDHVPGAVAYVMYRRLGTDPWYRQQISSNSLCTNTFEDHDAGWILASAPEDAYSYSYATNFTGDGVINWVGHHLSVNRAPDEAALNVLVDHNESAILSLRRAAGYRLQGLGPDEEGTDSPRVLFSMDDGTGGNDALLRQEWSLWSYGAWDQQGAIEYRHDGVRILDGSDNEDFIFQMVNGGALTIQNTSSGTRSVTLDKAYGTFIRLDSNSGDVDFGTRNFGNFFFTLDGDSYFVINRTTGNMAITTDIDFTSSYALDVEGTIGADGLHLDGNTSHGRFDGYVSVGTSSTDYGYIRLNVSSNRANIYFEGRDGAPTPAVAGMMYCHQPTLGGDWNLYFYNGSTWITVA